MASNQNTILTDEQLLSIKNTIALSLHNWARDITYRSTRQGPPSKLAQLENAIRTATQRH